MDLVSLCARRILFFPDPITIPSITDSSEDIALSGRQVIAESLIATLPAIDACDPQKTLVTLSLVALVQTNLNDIGEALEPAGFDYQSWVHDFLSRMLLLLENLEGVDAKSGSFLMGAGSSYRCERIS